jgi:hypothetical protein
VSVINIPLLLIGTAVWLLATVVLKHTFGPDVRIAELEAPAPGHHQEPPAT